MNVNKVFVIGLPRTGTTSLCRAMLDLHYKVAHTAYTQDCFEQAQVIADTPAFNDFQQLDRYYPNSKFIYLQRELPLWLPSIKRLLSRMYNNVVRSDGGFNPYIKRCYQTTFSPFSQENIQQDQFLTQCYQKHQQAVIDHFANRPNDLLSIDISKAESFNKLLSFLAIEQEKASRQQFEQLNKAGKVTAWNDISHPLKISSTKNGRLSTLDYLAK